jgi:hypothetical protein
MANNNDIQLDLNHDQAGQVIQNVPTGAQTSLAFRVDQSKIPEFWGQKAKLSSSSGRLRIWQGQTTGPTLQPTRTKALLESGSLQWLTCWTWTDAQLTWTNLKPRFQKQFVTQTDGKQIMEGLSNLAMGQNETTGELLARITNLMVIIKESYVAYNNKAPKPPTDAQGLGHVGLLENTARQWTNDMANNMLQFFKMQLFRASLPGDLRKGHGPARSDHDDAGRHVPGGYR